MVGEGEWNILLVSSFCDVCSEVSQSISRA